MRVQHLYAESVRSFYLPLLYTLYYEMDSRAYLANARGGAGEGNGTPLQYSCLENPMDGGAWWAAVHGVAKSRTRLK